MDNRKKFYILFQQFVKFGMVGVTNTFLSLLIYYILIYFSIHYIIANTVGFFCSVINAYYWNSKFVFKKIQNERNHIRSFIKVFISYASTFLLGSGVLFLCVDVFHLAEIIAPIISLCITVPLNFLLNKLWAMK